MIDPRQIRHARANARRHDHLVMAGSRQRIGINAGVQMQGDAQFFDHARKVAQGFGKLLLARHPLGQIELPADFAAGFIDGHAVAALRGFGGKGQPCRASAHHRQIAHNARRLRHHQRFMAGARIDQTRCQPARERVIQAGLVAGDAGVDLVFAAFKGLVDQIGISQHRPRHRHEIGMARRQHSFGDLRHVDAIGCDHRHAHMLANAAGHFGKGRARHHGSDGRHLRFMPGEMRADDVGAGGFHGLGQRNHFLAGHAALQHVHRRDAENQDEIRAHRRPCPANDLDRKAHAVFKAAAPLVFAQIGLFDQKRRQQIAGRSDDLHAVIAGGLGLRRAIGKIRQLLFDAVRVQFTRHMAADAAAHRRWCHAICSARQWPGMQDLQHDLHVRRSSVHRLGHDPVLRSFGRRGQFRAAAAFGVGRNAASDDHPDTAARPLGKKRRHAFKTALNVFKAGVHRPHQDAILELGKAQIERRKYQRIARMIGHADMIAAAPARFIPLLLISDTKL